jgi:hypothetical protein
VVMEVEMEQGGGGARWRMMEVEVEVEVEVVDGEQGRGGGRGGRRWSLEVEYILASILPCFDTYSCVDRIAFHGVLCLLI